MFSMIGHVVDPHREIAQLPVRDQADGAGGNQLVIGRAAAQPLLVLGRAISADQQRFIRHRGFPAEGIGGAFGIRPYLAVVRNQQLVTPVLFAQVFLEVRGEDRGLLVGRPLLVPVRYLDTDEHADHHDHEVDRDGGPLLVLEVLDQAAQVHLKPLIFCALKYFRRMSNSAFSSGLSSVARMPGWSGQSSGSSHRSSAGKNGSRWV